MALYHTSVLLMRSRFVTGIDEFLKSIQLSSIREYRSNSSHANHLRNDRHDVNVNFGLINYPVEDDVEDVIRGKYK